MHHHDHHHPPYHSTASILMRRSFTAAAAGRGGGGRRRRRAGECADFEMRLINQQLRRLISTGKSILPVRQWTGLQQADRQHGSILATRFSNHNHLLAVGDELGNLLVLDGSRERCTSCCGPVIKRLDAHFSAIFELIWTHDSQHIITSGGDQVCRIWDVRTMTHEVLSGHTASVRHITQSVTHPEIIVTGSLDGSALLYDLRLGPRGRRDGGDGGQVITTHQAVAPSVHHDPLRPAANKISTSNKRKKSSMGQPRSVTGVALLRGYEHIATGGSDGFLRLWDSRMLRSSRGNRGKGSSSSPTAFLELDFSDTQQMDPASVHDFSAPLKRQKAINSVTLSPDGSTLLVGTTNSVLHTLDASGPSYHVTPMRYAGHVSHSFYGRVRYSADGRYITAGSEDGGGNIWEVRGDGWPLIKLEGHRGEVNDVSFCPLDPLRLVSGGDDGCVRLWTPAYEAIQQEGCDCGWLPPQTRVTGRAVPIIERPAAHQRHQQQQGEEVVDRDGGGDNLQVEGSQDREDDDQEEEEDGDTRNTRLRVPLASTSSNANRVAGGEGSGSSPSSSSRQQQHRKPAVIVQRTLKDLWRVSQ